ncbi:prenyltransferase, UbiA family protein [Cardiosporidium cionae]|uniref:Heme O synthase n=1 Tax=Cardiosporidium cionae TaxID=476202 RepID=A0ABQ7JA53_9APIC|nr:prenyltransferase, UbiA family protein [Cardiosporidium cionae]|eukprot:KAF8820540.1 prenyltransferase, UbiA family protein [Cardiosporidium cionae]
MKAVSYSPLKVVAELQNRREVTISQCAVRSNLPILLNDNFSKGRSSESLGKVKYCTVLPTRRYLSSPFFTPQWHNYSEILQYRYGARKFSSFASSSSGTLAKTTSSPPLLKPLPCIGNVEASPESSDYTLLQNERRGLAVSPIEPLSISYVSTKKQLHQFIKDIMVLSKSKLSVWVVLSTLPGYFLVLSPPPISIFCCFALGTYLSSACAATLNQLYERKRDAIMLRTKNRPLATGRLSPSAAKTFALLSGSVGVGTLLLTTSPLTASISTLTIALYACVYTPLKVISPYNTHVGAIVGALPILMGCAAAGCSLGIPEVWLLFSLQYLWQFPHFYSLAWLYKEDYLNANFKVFPLDDNTGLQTAKRCSGYLAAIAALPVISSCFGLTSWMFVVDSLCVNAFVYRSLRKFQANPSKSKIRSFFLAQVQILALLILAVYHCRAIMRNQEHSFVSKEESTAGAMWKEDSFIDTIRARLISLCPHMFIDNHPEACPHQRLQHSLPFFGLFSSTQQEKSNDILAKHNADIQDFRNQGD